MTNPTTLCLQCGYSAEDIIPCISPPTSRDNILCHLNECLTEHEESTMHFFITEGQLKLATLENCITLVKALLGKLEVTKDELEVAISEKKRLVHLVRSFPTELLKEVFLHGAGFYSDAREHFRSGSHSLDVKAAPWLCGQVSHRWREVALSTPLLWVQVKIKRLQFPLKGMGFNFPGHIPGQIEVRHTSLVLSLLNIFLGCFNNLPLTIYLNMPVAVTGDPLAFGIPNLLYAHSCRWESLILGSGSQGFDTQMFWADLFPLLKRFEVWENSKLCNTPETEMPNSLNQGLIGVPFPNLYCLELYFWFSTFPVGYDSIMQEVYECIVSCLIAARAGGEHSKTTPCKMHIGVPDRYVEAMTALNSPKFSQLGCSVSKQVVTNHEHSK